MAEDLTRRRIRRALDQLMTQYPSLANPDRLDRLIQELEANAKEQPPMDTTPPKRKGRPPMGFNKYRQINTYMPEGMVEALDRRVERETSAPEETQSSGYYS